MKLGDIKTGRRLGLGFGIILLAFVSAGLIISLSLNAVDRNSRHITGESLPFLMMAYEIHINTTKAAELLTDAAATHNTAGIHEAEKAASLVKKNLEQFKGMFKRENDTASLKKLEEMERTFNTFLADGKKMVDVYITQGMDEGNKIMEVFDRTHDALVRQVGSFQKSQADEAMAFTKTNEDSVRSVKRVIFVIGGIAILLGIAVSVFITRSITFPISEAAAFSDTLAGGDLRVHIEVNTKDEAGQMLHSMNTMAENLRKIAARIKDAASDVASSSEELSATTEQISSGVNEQSKNLDQSAAALTEISQTIVEVARDSAGASEAARDSVHVAGEGKDVVERTVTRMMNIADNIENSSQAISELGESGKQIGDIIDVINDIAGQTNLLALNAAIEAARAGEQGRGFAVVADEVRKLAEKTSHATDEITGMIQTIQMRTESSVNGMKKNIEEAQEGLNLALQAQDFLNKIVHSSDNCLEKIQSIATATEQQSSAVEEVSSTIDNIAGLSASSSSAVSQINSATIELARIAGELRHLVSWFKTDAGDHADNVPFSSRDTHVPRVSADT